MKRHTYEYDEVVVGASMAAVLYAYINQCPLLFQELGAPHPFERFEKDFPIDKIYFTNELAEINTPFGKEVWGAPKLELYNRLLFLLSLAGLVPAADKISSMRVDDNNILKIATKRARSINFKFKKLTIFEPNMINDLVIEERIEPECIVYDRFKIRTKKHNFDLIDIRDEVGSINKIWFVAGEKRKDSKEIVVVSRLSVAQLHDPTYSLIAMKYEIKQIFTSAGIEKRDYDYELGLDYLNRDVYYIDTSKYTTDKNVIIYKRTEKEICLNIPQKAATTLTSLDAYPLRVNHLLMDSNGTIH